MNIYKSNTTPLCILLLLLLLPASARAQDSDLPCSYLSDNPACSKDYSAPAPPEASDRLIVAAFGDPYNPGRFVLPIWQITPGALNSDGTLANPEALIDAGVVPRFATLQLGISGHDNQIDGNDCFYLFHRMMPKNLTAYNRGPSAPDTTNANLGVAASPAQSPSPSGQIFFNHNLIGTISANKGSAGLQTFSIPIAKVRFAEVDSTGTVVLRESNMLEVKTFSESNGGRPPGSDCGDYTVHLHDSSAKWAALSFGEIPPEPLIFVPGIGGSVLKEIDGDVLWGELNIASVTHLDKLSLNPNAQQKPTIIATDALRKLQVNPLNVNLKEVDVYEPLLNALIIEGGFKEYDLPADPNKLPGIGCNDNQRPANPTLFVFPYDWRKSNVENAARLKNYVQCVGQFYPEKKVNIVAHSMGGLLVRRYILDNKDSHNLDKVITIGAPWLGAPKTIDVLERGKFLDLTGIASIGGTLDAVAARRIKDLAAYYQGAHELLPSRAYFELGGVPFVEMQGKSRIPYQWNQLTQLLNTDFPLTTPATTANSFHTQANPGQDS